MMKKSFVFLALTLCLTLAGCKKDDDWTPVLLNDTELFETTTSPQIDLSLAIEGGSGDYSIQISDPAVADARILAQDVGFPILEIETKQEGDAVITVTDNRSGLFARCVLRVREIMASLRVTGISYHVDANAPTDVLFDMMENSLMPFDGGYRILNDKGTLSNGDRLLDCVFFDRNGNDIAQGTITRDRDNIDKWNPAFNCMPIKDQIYYARKWRCKLDDGREWEYDVYMFRNETTRLDSPPFNRSALRLYEDLTEYYQTQFPSAGVRSAVRVLNARPLTSK